MTSPVTIGVISDIQTVSVGSYERDAVDRLLAAEPDLIVFTGDLFQGDQPRYAQEVSSFYELLAQLEAPGGVYLVPGDTDDAGQLRLLAEGLPVTVLVDEVATVEVADRVVKVAGVSLTATGSGLDVLRPDAVGARRGDPHPRGASSRLGAPARSATVAST